MKNLVTCSIMLGMGALRHAALKPSFNWNTKQSQGS